MVVEWTENRETKIINLESGAKNAEQCENVELKPFSSVRQSDADENECKEFPV